MIKAAIFDMDGVIIDSEPLHFDMEQKIFKTLGFTIDKEYHDTFVGTTSHYMWGELKKKFNLYQEVEELINIDRTSFLDFIKNVPGLEPIPGVKELIETLHKNNVKLAVASSSPLNMIDLVINKFKLGTYFSKLVTGDNVANSKPAPDIFLLAAELLSVKPEECLVIEDSCNGVKAAKAAGMKCIGYKNLNSGNQDISLADIITDNFSSLNIIDLLN